MKALLILALAATAAPSAAPSADARYEQLRILVDVLNYIEDNYVDEPEAAKLVQGAAAGMVRTLDPFSQYLDEEAHREIKTETEGQFGGIGIRVAMKDDWLTVITPLPGSPAYRQGVLPNDRVVEIDGEPTKDLSLSDALKELRGAPGTKVRLTILRGHEDSEEAAPSADPAQEPAAESEGDGAWQTLDFNLTRELVKIESVQSWMLDAGVGYARILEFSAKTTEDFLKAVRDLKKAGATSLVLDLRNNPGGLLSAAVDAASAFLGDGKLVVYTQGRKADSRQEFHSAATAPHPAMPLVVLINEGSASGAEIVAGALQDHKRAVVMGQRSFGKASVQSVIPLSDGSALRLTVARYYTPNGRSIHRDEKHKTGGITPDIVVPVPRDVEAKLYEQWDLIYARNKKPKSAVRQEDLVRDETLDRAVELLRARDVLGTLKPQ